MKADIAALRAEARHMRVLAKSANSAAKAEIEIYILELERRVRQAENGGSESRYGKPPGES
jgi:hypothetical protein